MTWSTVNTNQSAGWAQLTPSQSSNWSDIPVSVPFRAGVSGVGVSEASVSGASESPPDWTLIET